MPARGETNCVFSQDGRAICGKNSSQLSEWPTVCLGGSSDNNEFEKENPVVSFDSECEHAPIDGNCVAFLSPSRAQCLATSVKRQIGLRTGNRVEHLRVEEAGGQLIISGTTRTFHIKQLALAAAMDLLEGREIYAEFALDVCS